MAWLSDMLLGQTTATIWMEVDRELRKGPPEVVDLMRTNAQLRGKVSYYESVIDNLVRFKDEVSN